MEIAALIFSVAAFGMSTWIFVDRLADKRSTHQIQLVSPEDMMKGPAPRMESKIDPIAEDFTEFDIPDPAELALKEMKRKQV